MAEEHKQPRLPGWLAEWLGRHTPSCQEVVRLASEGLDRKLTWRERRNVRLHFWICFLCRRYEDQLNALHQGLGRHPESFSECSEASLSAEEKARLKKACSDLP